MGHMRYALLLCALMGCGGEDKGADTAPEPDPDATTDPTTGPDTTVDTVETTVTETTTGPSTTEPTDPYAEVCDDALDNDSDALFDCDDPDCDATCDADDDGERGEAYGGLDCDDTNPAVYPGALEVCDTVDNDCDRWADDLDVTWDTTTGVEQYEDNDGDTFGGAPDFACALQPGNVTNADDCDDDTAAVSPAAPELCNLLDDDCDALVDDLDPSIDPLLLIPAFLDGDLDGLGDAAAPVDVCFATEGTSYVEGDCDDADPAQGLPHDWYADGDSDGYGGGAPVESGACEPVDPTLLSDALGVDCADGDPDVHPGARDLCEDGFDDDCDGYDTCHLPLDGVYQPDELESSLYGTTMFAAFGQDVKLCDVTGDGATDVVVVSQGDGVYVFPGPVAPGPLRDLDAAYHLTADVGSVLYAAHCDVDYTGDGVADLVVGNTAMNLSTGETYVVAGPITADGALSVDAVATVEGPATFAYAGYWFAGPSDLDDDGAPELWIGSFGGQGSAWVVEGPLSGTTNLAGADGVDGSIDEPLGYFFGSSADFDGDGSAEVVFPAPRAYANGPGTNDSDGAVFVFSHRPVGLEGSSMADIELNAEAPNDFAGNDAVPVGDVNGDGYDDLAVGAPENGPGGAVYIMAGPLTSGSLGRAITTIEGVDAELFGAILTPTGDLDDDGSPDLMVGVGGPSLGFGTPFDQYLVDIGAPGVATRTSVTLLQLDDPLVSYLGSRGDGGADLDGDGADDLALGARYNGEFGINAGGVHLLFGTPTL